MHGCHGPRVPRNPIYSYSMYCATCTGAESNTDGRGDRARHFRANRHEQWRSVLAQWLWTCPDGSTGRFRWSRHGPHQGKGRGRGGQFEWRADAHRTCSTSIVLATCSTSRRATLLEAPQPPVDARLELWPYAGGTVDSLKLERPIAKEQHPSALRRVTKTNTSAGADLRAAEFRVQSVVYPTSLLAVPTPGPQMTYKERDVDVDADADAGRR